MLLKRASDAWERASLALSANEKQISVKVAKRMTNRVAAMLALCACAFVQPGMAQDMMRHVDLNSPDMTTAEMTRDEVAAMVKAATPGHPADFTDLIFPLPFSVPAGSTRQSLSTPILTVPSSTRLGCWRQISRAQACNAPVFLLRK
jgi:hypothetical protein